VEDNILERILDISRKMAETRHLKPLLEYAMAQAIELVKAERGYLVLLDKDGRLDFRVKLCRDSSGEPEEAISTSIFNEVIETRKPLVVTDALTDPQFSTARSVVALQLRSVMCVPLISRGAAIGAIYVENRSGAGIFVDADVSPLTLFANQAAVSIENAMLNDELEQRVADRTAELEEALRHREESWSQAVEADRMRTAVLSHVAHDVRAPLNIVFVVLSMLKDGELGELDALQHEWIVKSLESSKHAMNLMNDVFDMAKIEAGKLDIAAHPVPFHDFLQQIYEISVELPHEAGLEIALEVSPDVPPEVTLDPTRIRQVLFNLLTNAFKYTQQGSVTIYAQPQPDQKQVLIGVRDTGEGIPPDKLGCIFDRFTQLDSNPTRRQMGMGLGLAICRELVQMHGGRIWAESAGMGTDFRFTLPL
jgi:signal transduction histidine kinase